MHVRHQDAQALTTTMSVKLSVEMSEPSNDFPEMMIGAFRSVAEMRTTPALAVGSDFNFDVTVQPEMSRVVASNMARILCTERDYSHPEVGLTAVSYSLMVHH